MTTAIRPRVLLADDHRLVAEALKSLLAPEFDLVEIVEDGRALLEAAKRLRPDVIVADIGMPHMNGLDALEALRRENLHARVVFLTMHQEVAYARRAIEQGAAGFVLKHSAPAELLTALRAALAGRTYIAPAIAGALFQSMQQGTDTPPDPAARITPRQREVLQLLVEGHSAKEIAATLGISARTAEFHKYEMMQTLGIKHSAELIHFAIKHGLVSI